LRCLSGAIPLGAIPRGAGIGMIPLVAKMGIQVTLIITTKLLLIGNTGRGMRPVFRGKSHVFRGKWRHFRGKIGIPPHTGHKALALCPVCHATSDRAQCSAMVGHNWGEVA
jgi:hypothetical protein